MTYQRPDIPARQELERLLHNLEEEAAGWRTRSLRAEADLKKVKAAGGVVAGPELIEARQRVVTLEVENEDLRRRIQVASQKVAALAERLAFLERDTVSAR